MSHPNRMDKEEIQGISGLTSRWIGPQRPLLKSERDHAPQTPLRFAPKPLSASLPGRRAEPVPSRLETDRLMTFSYLMMAITPLGRSCPDPRK